jgi:hypothetical protein
MHEARPPAEPELGCERACRVDRRRGKIEPDDRGAALREAERVGAEVALQVQHLEPADLADLGFLDRVQAAATGAQGSEVIARRREMDGDALVPVGAIERAPVRDIPAHGTTSSLPVRRR